MLCPPFDSRFVPTPDLGRPVLGPQTIGLLLSLVWTLAVSRVCLDRPVSEPSECTCKHEAVTDEFDGCRAHSIATQ